MSTLITGSEGFLGARLAQSLYDLGQHVVGLDVIASATPRPWPSVVGNVTDRSLLERVFAEHDVASVVHCGGVSGPHVCNNFPARVFEVNVLGTLNLFEIARVRKLPGRIVFLSSSSVYGQAAEQASRETPVVERLPLLASEPYGCSKVSCEAMLRAYAAQAGIDAIALRVAIVYGVGRTAYCGITQLIKAALAGEPITLDSGCDVSLPWVYIDDVCSVLRTALAVPKESFRDKDTLAYNVTGPGEPTFRQIAQIVQKLVPGTIIREEATPDIYAMNARRMSLAAIRRDLGWEPQVSIRAGVTHLYRGLVSEQASASEGADHTPFDLQLTGN